MQSVAVVSSSKEVVGVTAVIGNSWLLRHTLIWPSLGSNYFHQHVHELRRQTLVQKKNLTHHLAVDSLALTSTMLLLVRELSDHPSSSERSMSTIIPSVIIICY